MSASDKFGLGYGDYRYSGILSYENEVSQSVFNCNKSDSENPTLHKRLGKTCEMQAVPPPMTGNYLPSGPDIEIDDSQILYGPRNSQPIVNESYIEVQPKVWSDAPIIEEYESDGDNEYVSVQTKGPSPSFANKQVKTPRENVKNQSTHSQKPKVNNKELGHRFTERACFVCGSFSHLIRDCDYHVKLAKQVELNKQNMSKGNGRGERKPTWNNVQRVNKQNQFVPLAVQTRTGINPVNTAKASSTNNFSTARQKVNKQTVLTSTALKVNTVKPIVNDVRPANVFHKTHSPSSRPFKRTTVLRPNFSKQKVYTAKVKEVSTVGGKWDTADNPHRTLKNKGIIDSGCSRHMTGNKAYLADFQDFNGGPVAFGGSKGYITGKGKIKTGGLACLIAKATTDESNLWHRRLGHVNFKNLKRFGRETLSVDLSTKLFLNDHPLVVAWQKGKATQKVLVRPRKGPSWLFDLDYLTDSMNYHSVRSENQANIHAGQQESNQNTEQVFLDDLARLQRQEKEANEEAEALRKNLEQETENLVTQAGAAKSSSTNIFSTVSTTAKASGTNLVNTVSIPGAGKRKGIDYDVFAPVARLEAIRIFLAFASYMGFIVYQMDVKSAFLYGKIDEEVYVSQPPGFLDPKYPEKVYKVVKALYGLHQAPRAWYATLSTFLLKNGYRRGTIDKTLFLKKDKHDIILVQVYVDDIIFGSTKKSWCDEFEALMKSRFQMSSMGELTFFLGLQVKQKPDGIFISQDKYVAEILKKFDFASVKTASTPIETQKPLVKDEEASDVDVHLYRSMIGSLMYVTASRPDIMFAVCACSRFQVTPKTSHLSAVKRIFRYLKGKPKLGLWYPRESSFDLESYSDSDYAGANLDRKSTTGGCQFLGRRLITWQCKKQTIVATSTTEAEYVAAASCCGQVLWIQNQMLDYGFNFMNTKIYIDNESTICIVVYHSKTKHIAIRHHFIRDAYEKKLIQVLKIHTNDNVADLLTKAFDLTVPTSGLYTFESKKIAQDVRARIQGKNSLVKHFEDMRLCRPSKEYFQMALRRSRESLRRVTDGAEAFLILTLFLLSLEKEEGASSERLSETQPSPSPTPTSEAPNESLPDSSSAQPSEVPFEQQPDPSPSPSPQPSPTPIIPDSIPEHTGENLGDHSSNDQSLSGKRMLRSQSSKRKLKTVSLQKRIPKKSSSKKQRMHKKNVSKQGRKIAKGESSVQRDPMFDVMPEDNIDHMEADNAQSEGRTKELVDEDKELDEDRLSTDEKVSTDLEKVSTDFEKISTDKPLVSTDGSKVSTDEQIEGADDQVEGTEENNEEKEEIFESTEDQREGTEDKVSTDEQVEGTEAQSKEENASQASQTSTLTPTSVIFGDDETIATLLINMSKAKATTKEKEKGVELKDVEEIERPRPTSQRSLLTLKPLPKIDPKDKGKKKIEEEDESESEDDDIPQAVKKFKQLESDEELARKVQQEWEAEEEKNRLAEEEATNEALIKNFDEIKARIEADRILAEKLQEQEREQFTIEERAKFLHDTIAAQRKFLAQQRSEAIRNRPPTKNQLRNQMMTFLKHVGNFKHSELKSKKFEDIHAMYEKLKKSDEDFIAIGSVADETLIKRMNKKDSSKREEIKEKSKEEVKKEENEESTRKRKLGTRKKMKSRKRRYIQHTSEDDSDKENDDLRLYLTIAQDEDKEVDY
ncbi:putative ribonuclease H-like domain-containing protein, partial [Tanacetum coccineum]